MRRRILFGSLAAAALLGAGQASRADHFFSVRSGPGGTYNVYRAVTSGATWDQARVNAAGTNWNGTPGHLANITSLVENRNVFINAGNGDWWIGLTDSDQTSTIDGRVFTGTEQGASRAAWLWENGEPYSDIGAWGGGEPNDWPSHVPPGEDAAHIRGNDGLWNDHAAGGSLNQVNHSINYVVEYDTALAVNPLSEWRLRTYQSTFSSNPGPEITNYASADSLINGAGLAPGFPVFETTVATDTTDTLTNPSPAAHFGFDTQIPGLSPAVDNNDFVVVGTGQVQATTAGTYTFRTTTDDGSRLRVSVNGGAVQQVITDDVLSGPHDVTGTVDLIVGDVVDFEWMWFERGGGATGELSYSPNGGTNYYLVGDFDGGLTPTGDITLATFKSNPGTVTTGPQLTSLALADSIQDAAHFRGEALTNTFNISNDASAGFYGFGGQAPGLLNDQEDFTVVGDGFLVVEQEGDYKFASLSDDGARLRINGVDVIVDDTLHGAGFPGDVKTGTIHLTPGFHPIEYMFFERGGGASGELWLADANNQPIALVGDVLNGGLRVVQQIPEPSTFVLGGLGLFGLALGWIRKKFKK